MKLLFKMMTFKSNISIYTLFTKVLPTAYLPVPPHRISFEP